jgi:segregation and condensation protein B
VTRKKSTPAPAESVPPDTLMPPSGVVEDGPTQVVPASGEPQTDPTAWDDQPTVNLTGDDIAPPGHPAVVEEGEADIEQARALSRSHLRGLLEALVFATDKPMKAIELARLASAPVKQVRELLAELKVDYAQHGIVLDEIAGGWLFRTSAQYAPFVRELSAERPVRLTRAQVETLAIVAYRQPVTRPEIDDIRGVDTGATLKLLLERDLVRILGKKDEPGRPLLYGTTTAFLEFFGLKSLKELPTLKEFTELSEESRLVAEAELGDVLPASEPVQSDTLLPPEAEHDTIAPPAPVETNPTVEDPDDEEKA